MNYIIFDLEWNQPADERSTIQEPVYLNGEIIEIGAVKLDDSFKTVDELRLYIKPQYYTKLHKEIVALTGIRDKDLEEKGLPFPEAYSRFVEWCGDEYAFMTWSMSDMPVLIDNMVLYGIDISDLPECCDIQRIFSREIMRGNTRYSLETAMALMKESGEKAHDALHDAKNTAKVCDHLELEQYLAEYTSKVFAEKPNGKRYSSRREVFTDNALLEFICPWCGQPVKCEPWLALRGGAPIAYGICPEGDEFLNELSVAYAGLVVQAFRRSWCIDSGLMVHAFRQGWCIRSVSRGAWRPAEMVHSRHAGFISLNYEFLPAELREIVCYSAIAARLRMESPSIFMVWAL